MVRRRKSSGGGGRVVATVLVFTAIGVAAWYLAGHRSLQWPSLTPLPGKNTNEAVAAAAAPVDPANEGRRIRIEGALRVSKPARDDDLGVQADALALLRTVQMRQWRETCTGSGCDYALAWSEKPVDSRAFRVPAGHVNATPFPFSSQRFVAGEARLGAFVVEPVAALADAAATPYAVDLSRLPPNLAATFRADGGALLTGDPAHPAPGDLRVSYAIVPAAPRTLLGVQRGGKLILDH